MTAQILRAPSVTVKARWSRSSAQSASTTDCLGSAARRFKARLEIVVERVEPTPPSVANVTLIGALTQDGLTGTLTPVGPGRSRVVRRTGERGRHVAQRVVRESGALQPGLIHG